MSPWDLGRSSVKVPLLRVLVSRYGKECDAAASIIERSMQLDCVLGNALSLLGMDRRRLYCDQPMDFMRKRLESDAATREPFGRTLSAYWREESSNDMSHWYCASNF